MSLIGADGSKWDLNEGAVQVGRGAALWGTAPAAVSELSVVGVPGTVVNGVRHVARDLVLPIVIRHHGDAGAVDESMAGLARAVDPVRGPVQLTVERPDGTSRTIDALCIEGLTASFGRLSDEHAKVVLSLRSTHPYWRSTAPVVRTIEPPPSVWEQGVATPYASGIAYGAALPYSGAQVGDLRYDTDIRYDAPVPYSGSASETLVLDLANRGDVAAWPVWEALGPCAAISGANLTTGKSWRLPGGLAAGQRLTIVTRPGEAEVRIDGQLAQPKLEPGADLWGLDAGENLVAMHFSGRSTGSTLTAKWEEEFLTC